jgi:hypothetical protein
VRINFGKYKGMDMSDLPQDYLNWIITNFDDGEIKNEARRILASPDVALERESKSLEEQANEILGEKPVDLLRRGGRGRPRRRR